MTIEVTDINIKIGQKKVSLSPEQARELMEVLEALLGGPEPKVVERVIERPWRWWYMNTPYIQPTTWGNDTTAWGNDTTAGDAGSYTLTLNQ